MQVKILEYPGLALIPDIDVTPNQEKIGRIIPTYLYEEEFIDPDTGKNHTWRGRIFLTYYE